MAGRPDDGTIATARAWLCSARRIVVLTGAGISTDSGIPDFRGPQGVWTRNPGAEKMATLQHYVADPEVRKRAWRARIETFVARREPNAGHLALVHLERSGRLDTLVTQNVDGLHHRAGTSPDKLIEIHGTVRDVLCLECGDRRPMAHAVLRLEAGEEDPDCQLCGGILKSATISFGQALVPEDLERAQEAAFRSDLLLAAGTTLGVFPIAGIVPIARRAGARIVIVNAEATEMDEMAHALLRGSISEILPELVAD